MSSTLMILLIEAGVVLLGIIDEETKANFDTGVNKVDSNERHAILLHIP